MNRWVRPLVVLGDAIAYPVVALFPRDKKKILFGAWGGRQFSDNPKYFMLYLLSLNRGYKCYWVGERRLRPAVEAAGARFVRKGSLAVIWHLLTSAWACTNINLRNDISDFPNFGRIKQLNFWHGTAFKGLPAWDERKKEPHKTWWRRLYLKVMYHLPKVAHSQKAFASFSSPQMCKIMPYAAPWSFSIYRSIAEGAPRIDYLIHHAEDGAYIAALKEKYARRLGLPADKKWYLYMPTWRRGLEVKFSFLTSPRVDEYNRILAANNAVIVEKQHPQVMAELKLGDGRQGQIYALSAHDAEDEIDTQELLLTADVLISDYSACFCDFMAMRRPVIHWAYDYDWYVREERNMVYSLEEFAAGPVAKTEDELAAALAMSPAAMLSARRPRALELVAGETGHACERFAEYVGLKGKGD